MLTKPLQTSVYEIPVGVRKIIRTADGWVKDIEVLPLATPKAGVVNLSAQIRTIVIEILGEYELHTRLHGLSSGLDHIAAAAEDRGKVLMADAVTGLITYTDMLASGVMMVPFTAQTSVTVAHASGVYPLVSVLDQDACMILPLEVQHTSLDSVTVTFSGATTGTILLTGLVTTGPSEGVETGDKYTGVHAGTRRLFSFTNDYLYVCVATGTTTTAVWTRIPLFQSVYSSGTPSDEERLSGYHSGTLGDFLYTDDYMFVCVQTGTTTTAIWKKFHLFSSVGTEPDPVEYDIRYTGVHGGTKEDLSFTEDYLYVCVVSGIAGVAIWKKTILFLSHV